jgi:hypothetical protein
MSSSENITDDRNIATNDHGRLTRGVAWALAALDDVPITAVHMELVEDDGPCGQTRNA